MTFQELNLNSQFLEAIEAAGFSECMPVQQEAIPVALSGEDLLVQSQTGSGKTIAFLIPVIQRIIESDYQDKCLVVVPTRELAIQIKEEAEKISQKLNLNIVSIFGGVSYGGQEKKLEDGVQLVIATPGRLLDLSQKRSIDLSSYKMLVIDEADRLFDMGFLPDLKKILQRMPSFKQRQTMLFSATLPLTVRTLAWKHMRSSVEIETTPEQITVEEVDQSLYHVADHEKFSLLLGILKQEKPETVLVFTNTRHAAFSVSKRLEINGYPSSYLSGDLSQKARLRIIDKVKDGEIRFLVATDVAARGLHIDDLELVVNYDLPLDVEAYVHRIGRTARAGKSGKAISLACEHYVYSLEAIEKYIKYKIPTVWADESMFVDDKSGGRKFSSRKNDFDKNKSRGKVKGQRGKAKNNRPETKARPKSRKTYKSKDSSTNFNPKKEQQKITPSKNIKSRQTDKKRKSLSQKTKIDTDKKNIGRRPSTESNIDDRMQYYKKKYGEDFKIVDKSSSKNQTKRGLWQKIRGFFIKNREQDGK